MLWDTLRDDTKRIRMSIKLRLRLFYSNIYISDTMTLIQRKKQGSEESQRNSSPLRIQGNSFKLKSTLCWKVFKKETKSKKPNGKRSSIKSIIMLFITDFTKVGNSSLSVRSHLTLKFITKNFKFVAEEQSFNSVFVHLD